MAATVGEGGMRALAVVLAVLALCGCQQNAGPIYDGPDVEAIRAADASLNAAIERRDLAAAVAHYDMSSLITEWLRVDEQRIGASGSYEQLFSDPNSALVFDVIDVEVSRSADLAVSGGECSVTRTNPATSQPESYRGHCMKSWRRVDGAWLIAREMRAPIHNRN
ncbi:MAG: DUF4440 domain-containing protein [Terricaulis sp.]